jgi:hypothetical protein
MLTPALRNSGASRGAGILARGASIATSFVNGRSFFDSNIIVYTDDPSATAKQRRAIH